MAIHHYLEDFANKTSVSWGLFAVALVITAGISLLTLNYQTFKKAGNSLLSFLKSLDFVTVHETEENVLSGKQAASEYNTIPLDLFISELHRKADAVKQHYSTSWVWWIIPPGRVLSEWN